MEDFIGNTFYNNQQERILDFTIRRISDHHIEISSFPLELKIPPSEITLSALYVSKEQPLADLYHISWLVDNHLISQIFSTEAGCFENPDYYEITFRIEPKNHETSYLKMRELFRHTPSVIACRREGREIINIPLAQKVRIRFCFKRIMSMMDKVWQEITTILPLSIDFLSSMTNNLLTR